MKFRNIQTVIAREYLTRVKKKSFLLITFLGPVFFAARSEEHTSELQSQR